MHPVELDPTRFAIDFNRRPFMVRHRLANHPAFRLERLIELARRLPRDAVEYSAGDLPSSHDPQRTPRNGLTVEETIRRFTEGRSSMMLERVEIDAEYRRVLDLCLDEIAPFAPDMRTRRAFVCVSSPGAVTPYQLDHEYNFVLQIRGRTSMSIVDRGAVSEEELERFYRGEHHNLVFSDRVARRAQTFALGPGDGVHVPVNAPHYVRNGPELAISFSITFRTPEGDRRSAVYSVNGRLRRLGITPRAVGSAPLVDRAKYVGFSIYQRYKRAQRRLGLG